MQTDRFMQQLGEFAGEHGMGAAALRNLMKSVLLVPQGETHAHAYTYTHAQPNVNVRTQYALCVLPFRRLEKEPEGGADQG